MILNSEYHNERMPNFSICVSFSSAEFNKYKEAVKWCATKYGNGRKIDSWLYSLAVDDQNAQWAWQTYSGWSHIYFKDETDLGWFLLKWA